VVPFESFGTVSYSQFIVTMVVSLDVFEICSIKERRDIENWVTDYSSSLTSTIDDTVRHVRSSTGCSMKKTTP